MNSEKNKQIASDVVLAQHGNKDAYRKLYLTYYRSIFFICKLMKGNTADAMKLTEEIFLKMYSSVEKLNDHMAFEQWFYSLAVNVCKNSASNVEEPAENVSSNLKGLAADVRKGVLDGDRFVFERSVMRLLEEVIISMPLDAKIIFIYVHFALLTNEKIAILEKKDENDIENGIHAVELFFDKIGEKLRNEGVDISPFVKDMNNTLFHLASHTFVPDAVHSRISEAIGVEVNPFADKN